MAVTARTLRLQDQLREDLDRIVDARTRALVAAWADAWDEVAPDLTVTLLDMLTAGDAVTRAQMLRSTRLRSALVVIAENLRDLAKEARVSITGDLQDIIDTAGAAQASVIDSQLPPGSDLVNSDGWARVDEAQIRAIVERSTEQITALTRPLGQETYQIVRRELIRGVAAGSNPRATAGRMVQRAGRRFGFGLSRALVIARTETLDAHRTAAALGQAPHTGVLRGWMWLAQLDSRTCPSCWAQHGSEHQLSEAGPLDHQQGRCARMPLAKSWTDLGFDVPEPAPLVPDAAAAFDRLTVAQQKQVLGPARFDAWSAGEFPMGSWSVRRSSDGWRDSYTAAPAPGQSGGRPVVVSAA